MDEQNETATELPVAKMGRSRPIFALLPGVIVASALAVAASVAAAFTSLPAVLIGLVLGLVLSNYGASSRLEPGLAFGSRRILRIGVALLGAQVTVPQLIDLGLPAAAIAIGGLVVCLFTGYLLARWLGLTKEAAFLTSAAVAICGASATVAVAAVLPKSENRERNAGATIAAITIIGTIAMIAYPALARLLGLNAEAAGVFIGASLHEVVQAVGAGFTHSEIAGEAAATVKLLRVACLAPVVALIGWWSHRTNEELEGRTPTLLPIFLMGFIVLSALASTGMLPGSLIAILKEASRICLLVAIVALGMKIAPRRLLDFGARPILALLGQTLILAVFALGSVILLRVH